MPIIEKTEINSFLLKLLTMLYTNKGTEKITLSLRALHTSFMLFDHALVIKEASFYLALATRVQRQQNKWVVIVTFVVSPSHMRTHSSS